MKTIFWMGVVEDKSDPLKLGRVRVRIYGWYSEDKQKVPTDSLPWAQIVQQPTSAAVGDVGHSPTGIVAGSWVIGIFLDGERAQQPIVLGTIAGIPTSLADAEAGFNDPSGYYPPRIDEPDVNRLARNDAEFPHPVLADKETSRVATVATATGGEWAQPVSPYNSIYPFNHVYESEHDPTLHNNGHLKEYDDTLGAARIHEYHKAGTFYEIDNEGTKVTRIVKDNYEIVAGDDYAYVKGSVNLTIDGDCNTYVKGDWNIKVDGNVNETIGGNQTTTASGNIDINGSRIDLN